MVKVSGRTISLQQGSIAAAMNSSMDRVYASLFRGTTQKIVGVAKNYFAEGETPTTPPIIFQKPLTSIQHSGVPIPLPAGMEVRYECKC